MNMHLPQARIVRQGGQVYAPPPPPPPVSRRRPGELKEQMRDGFAFVVGVWPVFAMMLAIFAMLILGNNMSAP
jgi:hypothetical protein